MDQREHDVEEDLKNILHTRMALADKIQRLERGVEDTVRGTRDAAVERIEAAKNQAVSWMESATQQLDPSVQAGRRPWVLVGTAVAVGFLAGWMGRRRDSGVYPYYPPKAHGAGVMPSEQAWSREGAAQAACSAPPDPSPQRTPNRSESRTEGNGTDGFGDGHPEIRRQLSTLWDDAIGELSRERTRLQEAALQIGRSFLRDLAHIAGQSLIDQLGRESGRRSRPGQIH